MKDFLDNITPVICEIGNLAILRSTSDESGLDSSTSELPRNVTEPENEDVQLKVENKKFL